MPCARNARALAGLRIAVGVLFLIFAIFAALEEQLGLRLESQKGTDEVLAIDHIQRPSEN